ncbi:MAG: hypothetical protein WC450_09385, partial [Candidatus Omnitrophota bacterium]
MKIKISKIAPNSFSFDKKLVLIEGKLRWQITTDFRTHNKFSKRIFYAFYPIWWIAHQWDTLFANNFKPAWNLGFDTLTRYPDASSGATTVDGMAGRISVNETWSTIRAGAGNTSAVTGNFYLTQIISSGTSNQWAYINRAIMTFDTSSLGASVTITAAVLSIYGSSKVDNLGITPNVDIYTSTPVANNNVENADYGNIGSTSQTGSPIAYNDFSTSAYNAFTFNATGRGNISKTGISKFGVRNASYDVSGTGPAWQSTKTSRIIGVDADGGGTTTGPKLVITYTLLPTEVSIQKSNKYCVKLTPSAKTKGCQYVVKSTPAAKTKSDKYTVKITPSAKTKSHKYCVSITPSAKTKTGIYRVTT